MSVQGAVMVPEMACRHARAIDTVASNHRPGCLGRQQYEQKDGKPAAHEESVTVRGGFDELYGLEIVRHTLPGGLRMVRVAGDQGAIASATGIHLKPRTPCLRRFVAHFVDHLLSCFRGHGTLDRQRQSTLEQHQRTVLAGSLDFCNDLSAGLGADEMVRVVGIALLVVCRMPD